MNDPTVSDLSREALESIVSTLLSKFDRTEQCVSWDNQDVADCAYQQLNGRGLLA